MTCIHCCAIFAKGSICPECGKDARKPVVIGHWPHPAECNHCKISAAKVVYDVSIPALGGRWGLLCHTCFRWYQCKLGTGRGQKFEWNPADGRWEKVAG